jgi:Phage integrase, N-terminal SAM-like domain
VRNLSGENQDDLSSGGSTVRSLCMAYDWRPTATRAATTNPAVVALPRPQPDTAAAPDARRPDDILVAEAVEDFIAAAEGGWARNRSGRGYRPSALRDIRGILRHHVVPELGGKPLRDVRPRHIQALLDRLAAEGISESRIRSVVSAIRALYGYAIEQGQVELSASDQLQIPQQAASAPTDSGGAWEWTDPARDAPRQKPAPRREEYEPIALLPERILSLVLRIVVVLFVLFALITIAGSIGGA